MQLIERVVVERLHSRQITVGHALASAGRSVVAAGSCAAIDARIASASLPAVHGTDRASTARLPDANTITRPTGIDPRSATSRIRSRRTDRLVELPCRAPRVS